MPHYVLNRDYIMPTTKGYRIGFKKDVPALVPDICVPDAVAIGATPADGSNADLIDNTLPQPETPESDPTKRKALLMNAVKKLVKRNHADDFGGDGAPKVEAIKDIVGFRIDAKERNEIWQAYHDEQSPR